MDKSKIAEKEDSKNYLILQLIEKIEAEKGGEIKDYENTMLCEKGMVTISIKIDWIDNYYCDNDKNCKYPSCFPNCGSCVYLINNKKNSSYI